MKPKISVIIPIYNVEQYLERCLQSVISQSLADIEIILVDDGSPDNCPRMCDEYALKDKRIKVIHQENMGLGFARNSGLKMANGEYVAFVDSDDFVDSQMYEVMYSHTDKGVVDAVFSCASFYKDGKSSIRQDVLEKTVFKGRKKVDDFLLNNIAPKPECNKDVLYMCSVWRAIYKKELIDEHNIRFLSERYCLSEDMPFNIDFLANASYVIYLPESYYYYCYNNSSLTKNIKIEKTNKLVILQKEIRNRLSILFPREKYILHFQRQCLLNLRQSIYYDFISCKGNFCQWKSLFESRLNEENYLEALNNYPIELMPIKFRIFYNLIKRKQYITLYILSVLKWIKE